MSPQKMSPRSVQRAGFGPATLENPAKLMNITERNSETDNHLIWLRINGNEAGSGDAENLVISDPIPAELECQPGSNDSALPACEEHDDDFAPATTVR